LLENLPLSLMTFPANETSIDFGDFPATQKGQLDSASHFWGRTSKNGTRGTRLGCGTTSLETKEFALKFQSRRMGRDGKIVTGSSA
jgi:hypothetical protein